MTSIAKQRITLEEFLKLPETKPASEYINGAVIQKPMPKGKHSQIQLSLCNAINEVATVQKLAYALPELRCTFGTRSIVPDIAVFEWLNIPFDGDGEIPDDFPICPDWTIEILSPEQGSNRVTGNILYCLQFGCRLGWLIDPADRSILVFPPKQEPVLYESNEHLPVLEELPLELTAKQVFDWLKIADV